MTVYNKKQLKAFHEAAQSLRLYRRADLSDPDHGDPLIELLYVDPLPEEQILQTALRPNTTFIVGRKGTGKSTIFQRLQFDLRKKKHQSSAYIDIKTLYESAQVDAGLMQKLQENDVAMSPQAVTKLLIHKEFLKQTITAIKEELQKRVDASLLERVKESFTGTKAELFEELDELLEDANDVRFVSVLGMKATANKGSRAFEVGQARKLDASGKAAAAPEAVVSYSNSSSAKESGSAESEFGDILISVFNINEFLTRLKKLLKKLKIRNLYLLVDDFSELPEDAMKLVVDVLLAPLNNWSDEFVKLKIAAYPGRIYYGAIDKTKIDEIYLDLYRLHGLSDVSRMEESAVEFTKRLVHERLKYFLGTAPIEAYFEGEEDDLWRSMFFATMGNPRNLGYLLHFLYEGNIIHQKPVTVKAIAEAARRYYEEKIEPYFSLGKFLHESFGERSSIYSLKELLENLVTRARELRSHDSSTIHKIKGRPPTSHFHVGMSHESLLSTLELNFFLTKYFEMSDRDGRKVAVFALNYGLCDKYTIAFGRPKGEREFRLYFVERFFDFTTLLLAYLKKNQEIVCNECGQTQGIEKLDALKLYGMHCPVCRSGVCTVTNLSRKYESILNAVEPNLLLPKTEIDILQTLSQEAEPLRPGAIAEELDCSYQLVGKRGKILEERGLIDRGQNDEGSRVFSLTDSAKNAYFSDPTAQTLDIGDRD